MSPTSPRTLLAATAAGALCLPLGIAVVTAGPANASDNGRHVLSSAHPTWATKSKQGKAVSTKDTLAIRVALSPRDPAGAAKFASAVSDPSSASYGHYLTASAYNARFGPTKATVAKVRSFLRSEGIKVTSVAAGNQWINARGSVASLNKAFGTTLHTYTVDGRKVHAPATAPSVPTSVASSITTVSGLTTTTTRKPMQQKVKPDSTKPAAATPPASQCSNYWGQYQQTVPKVDGTTRVNTYECGLSPAQLRKIYGTTKAVASGNDGHGQTVAIIDAYANPTMLSDANRYFKSQGEPTFKKNQYTETVFKPFNEQDECAGEDGWNGEESLDVEAVHAMAPGAKIHYIGAQNCDEGIDDAINFVIQNHIADIVSNSYGNTGEQLDPAEITLEHNMFQQAVSEGIGFYFSSGDDGDNAAINGLSPQPDYSASDPDVTAVGGTSELINKNGSTYATLGWETSLDLIDYSGAKAVYEDPLPGFFWGGAGGGRSTLFNQPYYQKGTVPRALSNNYGQQMRVVPDIAADADPYTGFYFAYTSEGTYTEGAIGGTSLACPLIAGIQAVASQNRKFPIGFANPLLYSLKSNAFHDVVPLGHKLRFASVAGSYTGTFEAGDSQHSRVGYDDITGRGTPNGNAFLRGEAN